MPNWYDDDALWSAMRVGMFPPSAFDTAGLEVAAILALVGCTGALDVLDLPCGPGRHALPLARVGHRVVAVDRTAAYLDELQVRVDEDRRLDDENAWMDETMASGDGVASAAPPQSEREKNKITLETVCADMREFLRPESFDLALNLYTSLGYFEDIEDDRRVLRNFRRSLRPGGKLVVDVLSREILSRCFEPRAVAHWQDGTVQVQERRVSDDWTRMDVRWTLSRDGVERVFDLSHRIYAVGDLGDELLAAGFSDLCTYGAFDGRHYDHDAGRLVVVAAA